MANSKMIIDDDYLKAMAKYFEKQGQNLDQMITKYVGEMRMIKYFGIRKGEVSNALGAYISYAQKIEKKLGDLSDLAKNTTNDFLNEIDEKDQYIF